MIPDGEGIEGVTPFLKCGVFPNPFRGAVVFEYTISRKEEVCLKIYDVTGRVRRNVFRGMAEPGYHPLSWDGRDDRGVKVPSGIYFYRFETPSRAKAGKLILIR
ncbi:hypothetical protein CH333_03840 [candidate division WOR-3 bacterium JGI_Cruoil_03_44_89]|uniref:FlgD/Vpr Ig-like domain-containing protein n=1 Tax=candidate division WOR-3 bacterium JGI_Cruoil_03_44_89 TaxID=1973748 RepID=A0A235BVL1_UNCW3|nr:MAG: hypothetical protein CH333_03840 [candidate division WOR-3 bacterium JGI_Cruoil_03_44_89]